MLPSSGRRARLLAHLRAALARAAGRDETDAERIDEDAGLFDLGLDSAAGVALVAELERDLDLALEPTLIYEHATLATLSDRLSGLLFPPDAAPAAGPGPSQSAPSPLASDRRAPEGARDVPASDDDDEAMRALEALLASDP